MALELLASLVEIFELKGERSNLDTRTTFMPGFIVFLLRVNTFLAIRA
jgi:hypothetical protein